MIGRLLVLKTALNEEDNEVVISACSNKFDEFYSLHDRQKIWQCDKDFFFRLIVLTSSFESSRLG